MPNQILEDAASWHKLIRKSCTRYSLPNMLLRAAGNDQVLRMKILEFIDVLPVLHFSSKEIYERFIMLVGPHRAKLPFVVHLGIYMLYIPLFRGIGIKIMLWLIYGTLAPHFIVADEKALFSLKKTYKKAGAGVSVDFLGELVTSEQEAAYFLSKYCSAIEQNSDPKEKFHISVKFSSLYPFFGPENYHESKKRVTECFAEILSMAQKNNAFVTVDAEHYAFCHLIEDIFCEVISREEFREMNDVSIALQAYRRDSLKSAKQLVSVSELRKSPFSVRLVKGAYWDTEIALSQQKNWPVPLFEKKEETDRNFEQVFDFLLDHWGDVYVSPATHNPESIAYVCCHARKKNILTDSNFAFQVLYGIGEPVRHALCTEGLPVIVYTPVGNLEKGMSYFTRRILENTSNEGFLFQLLD